MHKGVFRAPKKVQEDKRGKLPLALPTPVRLFSGYGFNEIPAAARSKFKLEVRPFLALAPVVSNVFSDCEGCAALHCRLFGSRLSDTDWLLSGMTRGKSFAVVNHVMKSGCHIYMRRAFCDGRPAHADVLKAADKVSREEGKRFRAEVADCLPENVAHPLLTFWLVGDACSRGGKNDLRLPDLLSLLGRGAQECSG